jgi:urease accessory protein
VVGIFALFHGHAHGGELGSAGALQFGVGFVIATALLHVAGIAAGLGVSRLGAVASRIIGALTALAGLTLAFGG